MEIYHLATKEKVAEMSIGLSSPGKFEIEGEARATAGSRWTSYAESMDFFIEALGITDA